MIGTLFRHDHGGKGSNQAVGAARLGAEVSFLTAVGEDAFGDGAFELWADEGVDASSVLRSVEPTMTAAILVEATGDNRIVIVPGALSALAPMHVDGFAEQIAEADVLLVQLEIPVETALHALAVGRREGVRTILNPAPAPVEPIAPDVDYLVPNETEAPSVSGAGDARRSRSASRARGSATSSCRRSPRRSSTRPAPATRSAPRSRSRWPRAPSDLEAVRWGCAAGAHMVEHEGVVPGLPTRAELEETARELTER